MTHQEAIFEVLGLKTSVVENAADAYDRLKKLNVLKKAIDDYSASLRTSLFALAEKEGTRDDKGGYTVTFADGTGYQKQARVSVSLKKDEALEFVKAKGIDSAVKEVKAIDRDQEDAAIEYLTRVAPQFVITEEVLDESGFESAVAEGVITPEEFESLIEKKTTFALVDLAKPRGGKKKDAQAV